ncbi:MAG: transketolase [Armatimonadetes bacterium]|nr:transketolase [Armatimonadota bacterium]
MEKLLTDQEAGALAAKANEHRRTILKTLHKGGSGHPGGSLSAIDLLTVLFERALGHDPGNPRWPGRDRFVLSKGHCCPALYVVMADRGFFPVETLDTFRKLGSPLQGHPDIRFLPALEVCTGSLGQGFSEALGLAIAGQIDGAPHRVYCMLGDGEINEGQVWEGALLAPSRKLDNFVAIIDRNGAQQCGHTEDILDTAPLAAKWEAFGWTVYEINGHDIQEINWALQPERIVPGKPTMIVAHTRKGWPISFMMDSPADFHGKAPNDAELAAALAELQAT